MSTVNLPLFLDMDHRNAAIVKHPRLWKRFLSLCEEQEKLGEDDWEEIQSLEDEKSLILDKMGLG